MYQYNSQVFLSSSDLSLTSRLVYSIAYLLFLLGCLMGTSNLIKTPYLSPQICSSTIFLISANGNSILPVAQAETLESFLTSLFSTHLIRNPPGNPVVSTKFPPNSTTPSGPHCNHPCLGHHAPAAEASSLVTLLCFVTPYRQ